MTSTPDTRISSMGRLLELLRRIQALRGTGTVMELYIRLRGADDKHVRYGYQTLAQIYELIEASRDEVKLRDDIKQPLYFSALANVENHFQGVILHNPDHTLTDALGGLMVSLELCADQIDRHSDEVPFAPDHLAELLTAVSALCDDLRESTLPKELKVVLVRRAEDLRSALVEYHLTGADGIQRACAAAMGTLYQHSESVKRNSKVALVSRYYDVVTKVDSAVRMMHRWVELGGPLAMKLLAEVSGRAS